MKNMDIETLSDKLYLLEQKVNKLEKLVGTLTLTEEEKEALTKMLEEETLLDVE